MTQEEYNISFQQKQEKYVKLQILTNQDVIIDEIQGLAIDGNIVIDSQNPVRRKCDIKLVHNKKLLPSKDSIIWLNKRYRILIGLKGILTDEIIYFDFGIFVMSNPTIDLSITETTMSIKGLDKTCLLNGEIAGDLKNNIIINANTPINQAIRSTAQTLGGENKLLIDSSPYTVPYQIKKGIGDNVWAILSELNNLYMNFELFYDNKGYLVFQETKNKINSPILWDFNDRDFRINCSNETKFDNIKNSYTILGKVKDDMSQSKAEYQINNTTEPNSDFKIEDIGERVFSIEEDKYYTNEQCLQRLNYEKFMHTNFQQQIQVTCLPIYVLDVNKVVNFNSEIDGVIGKFCITNINIPLSYNGTMTFNAYKLY